MTAKQYIYLPSGIDEEGLESKDIGYIESESNSTFDVVFLRKNTRHSLSKGLVVEFDFSQTGDRFDNKICDRCYKLLPTSHFQNNRLKKGDVITKRPSCKDCRKIKDGKPIPKKIREEWEKSRPVPGSLFNCPICNKKSISGISKIVLDHNHSTGTVRGWLCESCNTGIGRFDDCERIVQKAIDWLRNKS